MALRHVVLFRVHDGVAAASVDEVIDALGGLGSLTGIVAWRVERSTDARKGNIIIEDATFVDRAAFDMFRSHPMHTRATQLAAAISDWWVGDYET